MNSAAKEMMELEVAGGPPSVWEDGEAAKRGQAISSQTTQ